MLDFLPSDKLIRLTACAALLHCAWPSGQALAQSSQLQSAQAQKFRIDSVRIEGNTLLPDSVLDPLIAKLPGEARSLSDLAHAAAAVQRAYREAGYGGVVAFVPEQQTAAGGFVIRVIEGKLATVRLSGNQHFEADNLRAGLPSLREGQTPRISEIDRDIQLSNENPAKKLQVTLLAGHNPGEVDAEVRIHDRKPVQFMLGADNTGSDLTGRSRVSVSLQHANLSGRDDVLAAQYQTSPEQADRVTVLGLSYRIPLYARASSLDLLFAYSDVSNVTVPTAAGPLAFSGKGGVFGLRHNWHFERVGEYDHRLGLGLDWRDYRNGCSFAALGSAGTAACGPAAVSATALPLVLSYTGQQQSWGINASLFANAGGSSQATFDAARPGAKRNFLKTRFSAFGSVPITDGFALHGRLDLQLSGDALLSGEKFGIGGASTVRGYAERELSGDYGHAFGLELRAPLVGEALRVQPHLFIDQGRVANHLAAPCGQGSDAACRLASAGVGIRFAAGRDVSASLEWGHALRDGISTEKHQGNAHFSMQILF